MQRIAMNQQPQRVSHYHAAQMMNSKNRQELMHGSTSTDQLLNELSWIIQTASGAAPQSLPQPPFIYTLPPQQQQQPPQMYHVNQKNFRETMIQYHTGNVENRSGEGSIWSTPLCSPLPQMQPVSVASFPFPPPPPPQHHHYASSSSNNNSLLCSPSSNSSNFSPSPCSPPPMSARFFCGESNNTNSNVHHSNQSTPRPIRKALFVTGAATATATTQPILNQLPPSTSSNNTQSSNKMADRETLATMTVAKNGSELHARSNVENSNSSNEPRGKQGQQQRGGNSRSSRGPASGSPPSAPRHRHQQQQQQQKQSRQLPIRSKNIDLSQYLANLSLNNNNMPSDSSTSKAVSTNGSNTSSGDMKCAFCENNHESREVYTSHNLKDSLGKIVCPILRNFVCPKCGESGDYAHTDKYCPVTQRKHKENKIRKFFSSTATSTSSVAATSSFQH